MTGLGEDARRVLVVGTSCSGKSTLARRLSERLGVPHVELDALHWLPGWVERPDAEMRELVAREVARERWVVCGNYASIVADLTWGRATDVAWLDYPFPLVAWRAVSRTARRVASGEPCCNGNRETLGKALLSRDSILLWVLTSHGRVRRRYAEWSATGKYPHVRVHRLRSPRETERWMEGVAAG